MLSGSRLSNQFLLAHVLGQKPLAHTMVQFMRTCMVQIFPLQIDLCPSKKIGQVHAVIDRRRPSLEILPDTPKFRNELRGLRDGMIRFSVFIERLDQVRVFKVVSSVFAKITVNRRILFQIVVIISVLIHFDPHKCTV